MLAEATSGWSLSEIKRLDKAEFDFFIEEILNARQAENG